jgi:plasmid maintenance system killer protein
MTMVAAAKKLHHLRSPRANRPEPLKSGRDGEHRIRKVPNPQL